MPDQERIGRYEVLGTISQGGMGSVFLARDPDLHRQVAVKLLLDRLDTDEWRHRFRREAKALARLDHPNVVAIFDVGEDDRGRPFLVMEYVRGRHLGELIGAPLPLVQKLRLLEQLCHGLDYAHEAGVAHLDVKPANLIVDGSSRLRIVDFGIARRLDGAVTRATVPDAQSGTPSYMAPEQVLGETVGPLSDQFAAGAVAYELLSGRRAFDGTMREVLAKICAADPPPLSQICPDLEPGLEAIVRRALSKQPQQRFPSMAALGRALTERLEPVERVDSHNQRTVTAVDARPRSNEATTVAAARPTEQAPERLLLEDAVPRASSSWKAGAWMAATVGLVIVVAVVAYSGTRGGGTATRTATETPQKEDPRALPKGQPDPGLPQPGRRRDPGRSDQARKQAVEHVAALFDAGSHDVLNAIESAQTQYSADPDLSAWLTKVEVRARQRAEGSQQSAVSAGATGAPTFPQAIASLREAQALAGRGMAAAGVRKLWEADEQFAMALEWRVDSASLPPGPGAPAPETDTAVRVPLAALSRAYATLSAAAVKGAYTTLTTDEARALDRSFLEYRSYRLDVRVVGTTFQAGRAIVRCELDSLATLRSGEERRSSTQATFTLGSVNGTWVIANASRLPN